MVRYHAKDGQRVLAEVIFNHRLTLGEEKVWADYLTNFYGTWISFEEQN